MVWIIMSASASDIPSIRLARQQASAISLILSGVTA